MSTPRSLDLPDQVRRLTIQSHGARSRLLGRGRPAACASEGPRCSFPASPAARKISSRCCSRSRRPAAAWSPSTCAGSTRAQGATGANGYAPGELAADITAIAGALASDGQGVHLVGHSLGGLIAREAALRAGRPGSSRSPCSAPGPAASTGQRAGMLRGMLAMMDTAGREHGPGPGGRSSTADSPGTEDDHDASDDRLPPDHRLRATIAKIWDEHLGPEARADGVPEHLIAFLHQRMMSNSPAGLVAMGRYLLACPDRTAELANLGGPPILVLYGENDDAWRPGRPGAHGPAAWRAPGLHTGRRSLAARSRPPRPRPARSRRSGGPRRTASGGGAPITRWAAITRARRMGSDHRPARAGEAARTRRHQAQRHQHRVWRYRVWRYRVRQHQARRYRHRARRYPVQRRPRGRSPGQRSLPRARPRAGVARRPHCPPGSGPGSRTSRTTSRDVAGTPRRRWGSGRARGRPAGLAGRAAAE